MPLKLADVRGESFFGDPTLDTNLPAANKAFWTALIGIIDGDGPSTLRDPLILSYEPSKMNPFLNKRFALDNLKGGAL